MSNIKERNKLISDLERVFSYAFENNDIKSAIKAKEMIAKINGFISSSKSTGKKLDLLELSADEVDYLINQAQSLHVQQ